MLTVNEAATQLRVSRGAVYQLVRSGVLASVRIGRSVRIPERVLANFIEAGGKGWAQGWRKHAPEPDHAA
jgi:excisionase family DNA binding protein